MTEYLSLNIHPSLGNKYHSAFVISWFTKLVLDYIYIYHYLPLHLKQAVIKSFLKWITKSDQDKKCEC